MVASCAKPLFRQRDRAGAPGAGNGRLRVRQRLGRRPHRHQGRPRRRHQGRRHQGRDHRQRHRLLRVHRLGRDGQEGRRGVRRAADPVHARARRQGAGRRVRRRRSRARRAGDHLGRGCEPPPGLRLRPARLRRGCWPTPRRRARRRPCGPVSGGRPRRGSRRRRGSRSVTAPMPGSRPRRWSRTCVGTEAQSCSPGSRSIARLAW